MRLPKPPRVYDPKGGRPPTHGPEFRFTKPETWPEPSVSTATATTNSSGLPARRRPTSADPGRNRPNLHGSPRPGSAKNRRPAPRYDVGKPVNRPETLKAIGRPGR
ncbi:hypothetical protein [Streptomyces sp. VB1]|uniref:hypothetical protein n=1 Tax=Streptomyces sp. VB1 TaxID=2986803 RepID=UPI0022421147|nr:hypothetical protein OH133_36775 [Streptomyces sp. VB1]